jgi:hypothetical protein
MKDKKHIKDKKNKIILIVIIILAIIFVSIIYYFSVNAETALNEEVLPRHIFYHVPIVTPDPIYSSTCYPSGEVMDVIPGNQCCLGLDSLLIIDEAEQDCKFLMGMVICSDCGNDRCEYGENNCNCPSDCTVK